MASERVQVKLYAQDPSAVELDKFVPVFHRWIRDSALDELVIDVADYQHVHQGPGILLVGHGSDYYLDEGEGRPGLLYSRKRDFEGDGAARLADAFRRALRACQLLQQEADLEGLRFGTGEMLLRIPDRLNAPNTDETFEAAKPELEKVLARLLEGTAFAITREGTERQPFTVRIRAEGAPDVDTLLSRLA
ncbi:MAG: hypothetical protein ACOCV4_00580 [Myxococcota bacterium]